jgi:hypothetical protein
LQDGAAMIRKGGDQGRQDGIDGQVGHHADVTGWSGRVKARHLQKQNPPARGCRVQCIRNPKVA